MSSPLPADRRTEHPILSYRASSAASLPSIRRPNHASRFEGIPKTKLQASSASDPETLQSQVTKTARKRLPLKGLEVLHGRLNRVGSKPRGNHSPSANIINSFWTYENHSKS